MEKQKEVVSKNIYDWDTDFVYLSDKLEVFFPEFYSHLIKMLNEMDISYGILRGTKDIWCRDYMPIQVKDGEFIGYEYLPDYLDDTPGYPHIKRLMHLPGHELRSDQNEVWKENGFPYHLRDTGLILDGGNVVVCDEYVVLTDKIFSENKDKSPEEIHQILTESFDMRIPLTYKWKSGKEDVYGHSDGLIKFQHRPWDYKPYALISALTKMNSIALFEAIGDKLYLDLLSIPEAYHIPGFHKYAWAYINYLQVGNKILVPNFGMPSDAYVLELIHRYNPECIVRGIEMREIAECGGGLHCLTWNIKI